MKTFTINPATFDGDQFRALYGLALEQVRCYRVGADVKIDVPDSVPDVPTLSFAHIDAPNEKLAKPAITTIVAALEAGTATNAQVQNVLAKVLRYLRRENF